MEPIPLGQLMEELLEYLENPKTQPPMTRNPTTNHAANKAAFLCPKEAK